MAQEESLDDRLTQVRENEKLFGTVDIYEAVEQALGGLARLGKLLNRALKEDMAHEVRELMSGFVSELVSG